MKQQNDSPRIVAFVCSGRFQWYLLHRLQQQYQLVGVVFCDVDTGNSSAGLLNWSRLKHMFRYLNPVVFFRHLLARIKLPAYEAETEHRLQQHFPDFMQMQIKPERLNSIAVKNINKPEVSDFVAELSPDLVCVNGTNLIREPLLSQCSNLPLGLVNFHTGLSPYSRGGNCNLFMLLENKPELVGATIHYIDQGIDSGDIIQTLRPEMEADDPYEFIEAKVFINGFDALIELIPKIAKDQINRVKQWEEGKLFLKRTGYEYQLYHRLLVNKKINAGLIRRYLANKTKIEQSVRLIGQD